MLPVSWIAATRVCWVPGVYTSERTFRDQKAATLIERQALRNKLQDNESLSAGLTKLLLAAISTAFVSSVVYTTFVWQLGSRSLGGWVLEVVLLAWRVVEWPWKLLVWKPPSWYPLQVRVKGQMGTAWGACDACCIGMTQGTAHCCVWQHDASPKKHRQATSACASSGRDRVYCRLSAPHPSTVSSTLAFKSTHLELPSGCLPGIGCVKLRGCGCGCCAS